jgi:hypothetical protein
VVLVATWAVRSTICSPDRPPGAGRRVMRPPQRHVDCRASTGRRT